MKQDNTSQFHNILDMIRFGQLSDELDKAMPELVQAVNETGKVGSITVTLAVKKGNANQIEITDKVVIKKPEPARESTLAFASEDGSLSRQDPRQAKLDLVIKVSADEKPAVVAVVEEEPVAALKVV